MDNISFCGVCGFIREVVPRWALTTQDVSHIFNFEEDEETGEIIRTFFEPPTRDYGRQKYNEHVNIIFERLGIK